MSASVFVVVFGLGFCTNYTQAFLGVPRLYGPSEALSNTIENFRCEVPHPPKNESVLLTLLKRGNDTIWLTESTSLAGEPGIFILIIKPSHEGNLQCEARVQNRSNINPTFSKSHYLKVIVPVKGAVIEVLSHQKEFMEDQPLVLLCKVEAGNNVSYKWLLNNQLILQKNETYSSQLLVIRRTTVADSGRYKCEATNRFNDSEAYTFTSRSLPVLITVKGAVSPPKISYTVVKEDSNNYTAVVICQSTTGTPPITFSLYKQTEFLTSQKTDHRGVAFKVPVLTDQFLGIFHCQADNGVNVTHSQQISIHFVPVGGHVSLHYDYDVGENFAIVGLRLYCKVARGSHPRYQWFHNNTLLKDRGSFYYIFNQAPEQSILVMSVGKSSAGTYHCLVSDSFDNTTAISSKKKYLDKEVLNRLPVLVVAAVFLCFALIILLILICCGVVYWQRKREEKPLLLVGIKKTQAAYGEELNSCEYNDIDLGSVAADGCDFDQTSEDSADEWQQTKTTEDEAIEAL